MERNDSERLNNYYFFSWPGLIAIVKMNMLSALQFERKLVKNSEHVHMEQEK